MKLFVATLLLVAAAVTAKVAIEHLAPEGKASASSSDTRAKAAAGTVETVRFTGPGLRASFLADRVATREGAPLLAADLEADRSRIVDALAVRGYLDASADTAVVRWSTAGTAYVDFPVETGPIYVLGDVRVEGKLRKHHDVLAEILTVRAGEVAAADRIEASADLLRGYLREHRLRGRIAWTLERDPLTARATVIFSVLDRR